MDNIKAPELGDVQPEFLRVAEASKIYSLSRAKIYSLMQEGRIGYVSLRERGKARGIRLICAESLRSYISSRLIEAKALEK